MKLPIYFISPKGQMSVLQIVGIGLLFLGISCFIGIGINTMRNGVPTPDTIQSPAVNGNHATAVSLKPTNQATVMGLAMLLVTLAWPLIFPNMLRSSANGEVSSIRAVVFMIVAAFVLLVVRAGWTDPSLQELVLHGGWVSVLGIAFGAKTLQYWAETNPFQRNTTQLSTTAGLATGASGPATGPNAAPVTPNPGLASTAAAAPAQAFDLAELPILFHNEIANVPPATLPPAIQKALNSK